jgi:hypothetical protein
LFDGQSHEARFYPQVGISAGGSPFIQANGEALMNEVNNLSLSLSGNCIAALHLRRTFSSPQAILNATILGDGNAIAAERRE